MLGHLQPNSIALLNPHLFVAFGCQFYVFNTASQQCLKNIDLGHQAEIACARFNGQKKGYQLVSLDLSGILVTADLVFEASNNQESSKDFRINNINKYSLSNKNGKLVISKAIFISNTTILYLDKNHKLYIVHLDSPTQPQPIALNQVYSSIFTSSSYTFLIHQQNETKLSIFINQSQKIMKEYTHSCRITSVTNVENTLVIGDQRGKITLEYLYLDQVKNGKNKGYSSVLQWHTGPVLSLCSSGRYLYSAGHESVVVLWHTRDLSRDFLPRVGTAINHISINPQTNQIICVLSDNSVKIIDLSKDKQTLTFKTILDPKGYSPEQGPRFSPSTCAYHNGILCLNSVPGKVQFINLHKNIENRQLEIVPRNLVNGINNDKLAPHRITSFVFSSDWTYSCYSIQGESRSYLKFYKRSIQGYDAINKVESPHIGPTKKCVSLQSKNNVYFVTFSQEDEILRVWTEHSQKKKSILDVSEVYWKCSQEIGFRGLKPTSIDARAGLLLVVYAQHQIVIYQLDSQGILTIMSQTLVCQKIKQSRILSPQIQKPSPLKLITQTQNNNIQIWNWHHIKTQTQVTIQQKLSPKQQTISQYIIISYKHSAVILNYQKELSQIIIIDNKSGKFIQLYSSDSNIQTLFWHCDRPVVVGQDFMICGLDGGEIVRFVGEGVGEIVGGEDETDVVVNFGETNIFKINQKWVERQTLKNKNKVSDCTQSLSLLPSCVSMWQQMSTKLLL